MEELSKPELTGNWEYKLAQIEHGKLSRAAFMQDIAAMTERIVRKAKEYDRDTVPGNYATLATPCPNCGGVVKENYRRYACTGAPGATEGCGFSIGKTPGGRTFDHPEVEQLLADKRIGPLEGFRSKAGWPFTAELQLVRDEELNNWKLEFDFGNEDEADSGELADFAGAHVLGKCPSCGSNVVEHGSSYVCEKAVPTVAHPTPSCKFKTGTIILQQPISHEQLAKLLVDGKTDLLDKFISNKTRRAFKAFLVWDAAAGKVGFEFEPRAGGKGAPARRGAAAAAKAPAKGKSARAAAGDGESTAGKPAKATKAAAGKTGTKASASKAAAPKKPRASAAGTLKPSTELAAVIGDELVSRPQAMKKIWDYIKAQKLQDPKDKRTIVADDKLRAVLGADSVNMFAIAGIIGKHVS